MTILEKPRLIDASDASAPDGDQRTTAVEVFRKTIEAGGVKTDYDAEFHEPYGIDFVVTRIRGVHAHVNLGVQVVIDANQLDSQEKFLDMGRRGIVHKSMYLELDPRTVATGAIPVAIAACMSFLFDRRYQHFKSIGLRVFEDCTFHYFDVEENVRRLKRETVTPGQSVGQEMKGNIIAYFTDKGFGFIEVEKDHKFFFHIANVIDDELRSQLPAYQPGDDMPVVFKFGGHDGKKYPKALEVSFDADFEEDVEFEDEEY
jgi:cold shock CspA family protein